MVFKDEKAGLLGVYQPGFCSGWYKSPDVWHFKKCALKYVWRREDIGTSLETCTSASRTAVRLYHPGF